MKHVLPFSLQIYLSLFSSLICCLTQNTTEYFWFNSRRILDSRNLHREIPYILLAIRHHFCFPISSVAFLNTLKMVLKVRKNGYSFHNFFFFFFKYFRFVWYLLRGKVFLIANTEDLFSSQTSHESTFRNGWISE